MQDEVTKHSKKIYNLLKNNKNPFTEKVKEIVIEIFIIVFSVTLSIWLHNWTQHRHQQKETTEFLADLRDDLNKDIKSMSEKRTQMSQTIKQYDYLRNLNEKQIDSLTVTKGTIGLKIEYLIRKTNNGNYEGFKSSGKIGYIENKKLKKLILGYYQESMPSLDEAEKYYNSGLNKIVELACQNTDKMKIYLHPTVKTSFSLTIQSAESNKNAYNEIIKEAKEIISEIDKEEKE